MYSLSLFNGNKKGVKRPGFKVSNNNELSSSLITQRGDDWHKAEIFVLRDLWSNLTAILYLILKCLKLIHEDCILTQKVL